MTATDDDNRAPAGGRDVVDQLCSAGALDGLFEQIDSGQVSMTGANGLLPAMVKEAPERGLAAELTEHLGYDKSEPTTQARGNARNGTTSKIVDSEVDPFETLSSLGFCGGWFIWFRWLLVVIVPGGGVSGAQVASCSAGGSHPDGGVWPGGARTSGPTRRWRARAASMSSQGPWLRISSAVQGA